ncbi:MAG: type II toxin-antitoxin system RelE/ParE family toxin [Nitrospinales bacterium]
MKVDFKRSFDRDLKRIKSVPIKNQVKKIIESVEEAQHLQEIKNIKKLGSGNRYYRIRIGDYRVGLSLENDIMTFVRFLHRKELYRYFP